MRLASVFAAAALSSALVVGGTAYADPPHCPPGHAKKGWCDTRGHDRDWNDWRRIDNARDRAYDQGYREGLRDAWRVGQRIPSSRYRVVPDYYEYGWPAPGLGQGYVRADGRDYLINLATGMILNALTR